MRRLSLLLLMAFLSLIPVFAQDNTLTIAELIQTRPELSQFSAAVDLADPSVLEMLNDPDAELSLFAPTDAAFDVLAQALTDADSTESWYLQISSMDDLLGDQDLLTDFVLHHISPGKIDLRALMQDYRNDFVDFMTLDDGLFHMSATFDSGGKMVEDQGISINGSIYIDLDVMDIQASNGVIYLLDGVLLPETRTIAQQIAESASYPDYPEFTIFAQILEAADPAILELLDDPSANVTLFIPFDEAFEDVDTDTLTSDSTAATAFIQHLIFSDLLYAIQLPSMLNEDGIVEIEMMDGSSVKLSLSEDDYFNEFYFDDAYVGFPDWTTKNGIMQALDNLPTIEG